MWYEYHSPRGQSIFLLFTSMTWSGNVSIYHRVLTGPDAHSASYPMGTGD